MCKNMYCNGSAQGLGMFVLHTWMWLKYKVFYIWLYIFVNVIDVCIMLHLWKGMCSGRLMYCVSDDAVADSVMNVHLQTAD